MKIHCPQCGVKGALDDAFAGKKIQCPRCKVMFVAGQRPVMPQDEALSISNENVVEGVAEVKAEVNETPGNLEAKQPSAVDASADSHRTRAEESSVCEEPLGEEVTNSEIAYSEVREEQTELLASLQSDEEIRGAEETVAEAEVEASDESMKPPPVTSAGGTGGVGTANVREKEEETVQPEAADQGSAYSARRFTIGRALSKAWELTSGVKAPIWGGLLITYGVTFVLISVLATLIVLTGASEDGLLNRLGELGSSFLSVLFTAGLMFMGVKRATGRQVVWKDVFSGFDMTGKVLIAGILQGVLVIIGFMLLILPGIYLMIGYLLTFPLIIDRKMSPWQAMEASRKAIHKVWWRIFGLYIITILIIGISAIPLGIGLIWTAPMAVILCGVVYNYLLGTRKKAD